MSTTDAGRRLEAVKHSEERARDNYSRFQNLITNTAKMPASRRVREPGQASGGGVPHFFKVLSTCAAALADIAASVEDINFVVSILSHPTIDRKRHVNVRESWFFGNVYTHIPSYGPVCVT